MADLTMTFSDNVVVGLAHNILRLRGKDPRTCGQADLRSAYDRAEGMAESMLRVATRIAYWARKEAA